MGDTESLGTNVNLPAPRRAALICRKSCLELSLLYPPLSRRLLLAPRRPFERRADFRKRFIIIFVQLLGSLLLCLKPSGTDRRLVAVNIEFVGG
jgi:hypothetical protein